MPTSSGARLRRQPAPRRRQTPEVDWRELVRVLVEHREKQGLTQAEVARRMRTSQPYVARLETANVDPRASTIFRYALVVLGGIALAQLLKEVARGGVVPRL